MLTDAVTPALIVHISAGSLAIVSGAAALFVQKGGRFHRAFGTAFVACIFTMSAMGAYLAILIPQRATAVVGLFTFYFVATAWMTVKRKAGSIGGFEVGAFVFALSAAAVLLIWGIMAAINPSGLLDGIPPAPYWIAASFAAFVAALDFKMLLQAGIALPVICGGCALRSSSPRPTFSLDSRRSCRCLFVGRRCFICRNL
jgi:uncharacterized membrane protein